MMQHFRREVDSPAENGLSREQHDAVAAGVISPVSEGEDAENRAHIADIAVRREFDIDCARELSNKLRHVVSKFRIITVKQRRYSNSSRILRV